MVVVVDGGAATLRVTFEDLFQTESAHVVRL
jgi:hypothetical protein